jgi:phenylalanyl-tRNA synthetase alpha chain
MDTFICTVTQAMTARPTFSVRTHRPCKSAKWKSRARPSESSVPAAFTALLRTHTLMFHQVEGLAIDKNLSMANLKCSKNLHRLLRRRSKPFPRVALSSLTELSAEVDIHSVRLWRHRQSGRKRRLARKSSVRHGPPQSPAAAVDPEECQGFAGRHRPIAMC